MDLVPKSPDCDIWRTVNMCFEADPQNDTNNLQAKDAPTTDMNAQKTATARLDLGFSSPGSGPAAHDPNNAGGLATSMTPQRHNPPAITSLRVIFSFNTNTPSTAVAAGIRNPMAAESLTLNPFKLR
jgi:hypothetical protein